MARIAWLFLFVLLCIAIYFGWQATNREPVTLAPVTIEIEKAFVNPYLPTGKPTEGVVSGVDAVKERSSQSFELSTQIDNYFPSGEPAELVESEGVGWNTTQNHSYNKSSCVLNNKGPGWANYWFGCKSLY